jgi:hypothetical protein
MGRVRDDGYDDEQIVMDLATGGGPFLPSSTGLLGSCNNSLLAAAANGRSSSTPDLLLDAALSAPHLFAL